MEIESLHKYIALNNLANGTVEVMFAGQPCLTITEGGSGSVWKINPVFAKLVYGANIFEDIPVCSEGFSSTEEAVAAGLVKLHTLGAFNTEVDFPEDTYAATMKLVAEDVKNHVLKSNKSIMESHKEYSGIMKSILENTFVSEQKFNDDDYYLVDKDTKKVVSNVGQKRISPEHYSQPEKSPMLSGYIKSPSHTILSGMGLRKHGYTNEETIDESRMPLKGHPYHKKSDTSLRYIVKDAGEAAVAMKDHSPKSEAKYLDQVNDASTVLHYRKTTNTGPVTEGSTEESDDDTDNKYGKWESDVRAAHPKKNLEFKNRVEKGTHTTSAEENGKDRSYGVWDHDKSEGHVLGEAKESEKEEAKEVLIAIKKDKKFMAKCSKDDECSAQMGTK